MIDKRRSWVVINVCVGGYGRLKMKTFLFRKSKGGLLWLRIGSLDNIECVLAEFKAFVVVI